MSSTLFLSVLLAFGFAFSFADNALAGYPEPALESGLSWTFYQKSCPKLESIVQERIRFYLNQDITDAAGMLRLHFHDCFVQGCDGSVLLVGSGSEQTAAPNTSLREKAIQIVNDIKARVDKACGVVVSCADVTALAAKESVKVAGGPNYRVPLGRRDSTSFASVNVTLANLPAPSFNVTQLINAFAKHNLNVTDMVALSGGHTIGISHCAAFSSRLSNDDPTMNKSFAKNLKKICVSSSNTTNLDVRTPNVFDNRYYVNLMNRQGLFTSDQDLYSDKRTKQIVLGFAKDQNLFFEKFAYAMGKMGQLQVLTGRKGEIRNNCSVPNSKSMYSSLGSVVEEAVEAALSFF